MTAKIIPTTQALLVALTLIASIAARQHVVAAAVEELHALLYPNKTAPRITGGDDSVKRRLSADSVCVTCSELEYCQILNGYMVEEVYLPSQISVRATCTVLEQRAKKYAATIFGPGRTFKDSEFCLNIVLQYLCLFWGSDNPMYSNGCIDKEDYSDPDPANQKKVQRPPCRSFCVQISELCAQDENFLQVCSSIVCPPVDESCVPSPVLDGTLIVTDLACTLPFQEDPYKSAAVATISTSVSWISVLVSTALQLLFIAATRQ